MGLLHLEIGESTTASGGKASCLVMQARRANLKGAHTFAVEVVSGNEVRITRTNNPVLNGGGE